METEIPRMSQCHWMIMWNKGLWWKSHIVSGSRLVPSLLNNIYNSYPERLYGRLGCFLSVNLAALCGVYDSVLFGQRISLRYCREEKYKPYQPQRAAGDRLLLWFVTSTPPTHQQGKQQHLAVLGGGGEKHSYSPGEAPLPTAVHCNCIRKTFFTCCCFVFFRYSYKKLELEASVLELESKYLHTVV